MTKLTIRQQLDAAFKRRPEQDGILHGLRPIHQGKHGSRSSLFFSAKNEALIPVESRLEQAFCYVLEANDEVRAYRTQSLAIVYRGRDIYPDFQVLTAAGGYRVIEVKPAIFQGEEKNRCKANFMRQRLSREGIPFEVVNEERCCAREDFAELSMLYNRGGRYGFPLPLILLAREMVEAAPGARLPVAELRAQLASQGMSPHLVEAAVFKGVLRRVGKRFRSGDMTDLEVAR